MEEFSGSSRRGDGIGVALPSFRSNSGSDPLISVIVPTLNEAGNVSSLCSRIGAVLQSVSYEIAVVDDGSTDGTLDTCRELQRDYPLATYTRAGRAGGLSGAILHGFAVSRGAILVVMDADLQHPPERIPELVSPLIEDVADFVIGSRYVAGGSIAGGWGIDRQIMSTIAAILARPLVGRISDPMSGFFALRRSSYLEADRIDPVGFKLGIELIRKCRFERIAEIPIHFGLRLRGRSKLNCTERLRYAQHLWKLYRHALRRNGLKPWRPDVWRAGAFGRRGCRS